MGTHKNHSYLEACVYYKSPSRVLMLFIIKVFHRGPYGSPSRSDWTRGVQFLLDGVHIRISKKNINCDFPGLSEPSVPPLWIRTCIMYFVGFIPFENRPTDYWSFNNRLDSSVGRASAFGAGSQEFRSGLQHTISIY